ncbi:MAG: HK97 gp10 family phage protein [Candidatus Bathyarchaeia archaeon]
MSEFTIGVRGLEEALQRLEIKATRLRKELQALLHQSAERVVGNAKALAPVRTGHLMDSIRILGEGDLEVTVGSEVEYAGYVEYGTSRMPARPYLRSAIALERENLVKALQALAAT